MLAWRSLLILTCGYKEKEKTIFIQSNFLAINIDRNSQERITIRTDINVTNSLKYRVKIAGWMMLAAISIGAPLFIINTLFFDANEPIISFLTIVCGIAGFVGYILQAFRNLSYIVFKKLAKRTKFQFTIGLLLTNFLIDVYYPYNSFSPINGLLYCISGLVVFSMDMMEIKGRKMIFLISSIYFFLTSMNIYSYTAMYNSEAKRNMHILGQVFYKVNIKRTIYKTLLTLILRGLYVLYKDKKQIYLAFATKRMNRETGTSRKSITMVAYINARQQEHRQHSQSIDRNLKKDNSKKQKITL